MKLKINASTLGFKEKRMQYAGIELLRFILAFFVFLDHVPHDHLYMNVLFYSFNGTIAVPTFAIITGYFSAHNKKIKIFNLINTLIVYLLVVLILQISITGDFGLIGNINNFEWFGWYFIALLAVMLLSPLLNKLILNINKWYSLILLVCLFCLVYSNGLDYGVKFNLISQYNNIVYLIFYYCTGAWIKTHLNLQNKKRLYIYGIIMIIVLAFNTLHNYSLVRFGPLDKLFFRSQLSIFCVVESICIFTLFLNIKIKYKWINFTCLFLGMISIGVYIFQKLFMEPIWFFHITDQWWILAYIVTVIFSSVLVFPLRYVINKLNGLAKFKYVE